MWETILPCVSASEIIIQNFLHSASKSPLNSELIYSQSQEITTFIFTAYAFTGDFMYSPDSLSSLVQSQVCIEFGACLCAHILWRYRSEPPGFMKTCHAPLSTDRPSSEILPQSHTHTCINHMRHLPFTLNPTCLYQDQSLTSLCCLLSSRQDLWGIGAAVCWVTCLQC